MFSSLKKLRELIQRLRQPQGCAWTRQQTFESLAPQTLEECYELIEAIEKGDVNDIRDELADLLYHTTLYAQLADENSLFDLNDVAQAAVQKHLDRMPAEEELVHLSAIEVSQYWDKMKAQQRQHQRRDSILDDISSSLPAISRATKLQERAAEVGFDWDNITPVFDKIHEEIDELKHELEQQADQHRILDEYGDLLFACINLGRHLNIEPETALRHGNRKFYNRFRFIEQQLKQSGKELKDSNLDEMEALWQKAKNLTKGSSI